MVWVCDTRKLRHSACVDRRDSRYDPCPMLLCNGMVQTTNHALAAIDHCNITYVGSAAGSTLLISSRTMHVGTIVSWLMSASSWIAKKTWLLYVHLTYLNWVSLWWSSKDGRCCVYWNKYYCWYTANILNISVFDALSIGSGLVAAVLLCIEQEAR